MIIFCRQTLKYIITAAIVKAINELINLYGAPFPIGILHYASDTPMSKGKNLGSRNLSYFGMDPTYGAMTAILHEILAAEIDQLRR